VVEAERFIPFRTYCKYGQFDLSETDAVACISKCLRADMYREIDDGARPCWARKAAYRQRVFWDRGSGGSPALSQNSRYLDLAEAYVLLDEADKPL
jgi:hypothetical protein